MTDRSVRATFGRHVSEVVIAILALGFACASLAGVAPPVLGPCMLSSSTGECILWTGPKTVSAVMVRDGEVIIYLSPAINIPKLDNACPDSVGGSEVLFSPGKVGLTSDDLKLVYASALVALTSGKLVDVYFDAGHGVPCYGNGVKLQR